MTIDAKDFAVAARIMADLQVNSVRLITDNPAHRIGLETQGTAVLERVPTSELTPL